MRCVGREVRGGGDREGGKARHSKLDDGKVGGGN